MPTPPINRKTEQEKALVHIQSELWHLAISSEALEGAQRALETSLDELTEKVDHLTNAVTDLTEIMVEFLRERETVEKK